MEKTITLIRLSDGKEMVLSRDQFQNMLNENFNGSIDEFKKNFDYRINSSETSEGNSQPEEKKPTTNEGRQTMYGTAAKLFPYTADAKMRGQEPGFKEGFKDVFSLPGRAITSLFTDNDMGVTSEEANSGNEGSLVQGITRNPWAAAGAVTAPIVASIAAPLGLLAGVGAQGWLGAGLAGLDVGTRQYGYESKNPLFEVYAGAAGGAAGEIAGATGSKLFTRHVANKAKEAEKILKPQESGVTNTFMRGQSKMLDPYETNLLNSAYKSEVNEAMLNMTPEARENLLMRYATYLNEFRKAPIENAGVGEGTVGRSTVLSANQIGKMYTPEEKAILKAIEEDKGLYSSLLAEAERVAREEGIDEITFFKKKAHELAEAAKDAAWPKTKKIMESERDIYGANNVILDVPEQRAKTEAAASQARATAQQQAMEGTLDPKKLQQAIELENNASANTSTAFDDAGLVVETLPGTIRRESNLQAKDPLVTELYEKADLMEEKMVEAEAKRAEAIKKANDDAGLAKSLLDSDKEKFKDIKGVGRNQNLEKGERQLVLNNKKNSPIASTDKVTEEFSKSLRKNLEDAEVAMNSRWTTDGDRTKRNYKGGIIPPSIERDLKRARDYSDMFESAIISRAKANGLGIEGAPDPRVFNEDIVNVLEIMFDRNDFEMADGLLKSCKWIDARQAEMLKKAVLMRKGLMNIRQYKPSAYQYEKIDGRLENIGDVPVVGGLSKFTSISKPSRDVNEKDIQKALESRYWGKMLQVPSRRPNTGLLSGVLSGSGRESQK